mgnify:CR=1 FL=1
MINWWLIGLLVLSGVSWGYELWDKRENKIECAGALVAFAIIGGMMYMAGIFTELWSVYK